MYVGLFLIHTLISATEPMQTAQQKFSKVNSILYTVTAVQTFEKLYPARTEILHSHLYSHFVSEIQWWVDFRQIAWSAKLFSQIFFFE